MRKGMRQAPGVHQGCAEPAALLRGAPGVRLGHGAGQLQQWHMRNRIFLMNFGCDGEVSSGGEVLLLLSSPEVLIRSGALRRSGRVYLDTAPATRHDDGRVERGGENRSERV